MRNAVSHEVAPNDDRRVALGLHGLSRMLAHLDDLLRHNGTAPVMRLAKGHDDLLRATQAHLKRWLGRKRSIHSIEHDLRREVTATRVNGDRNWFGQRSP